MSARPLFTVCVPAYNRAHYLPPLLVSILEQDYADFDVLVCEDLSPERPAIAQVVRDFQQRHPGRVRYEENESNLGYDGNIRRLLELANGHYAIFMGNDDLMSPGALRSVAESIGRSPNCAVVVRSYATFDTDPSVIKQVFRYFPTEVVIGPGEQAIATAFRRSVVIPGMVIHRDSAVRVASDRFDGTLLYQLYVVGMVLRERSAVFTPQVLALRRDGTPPDFGNSPTEQGKFVPREQTPESSIHFMKGMLEIARHIQEKTGLQVYKAIENDIGNYSYPILSIQAHRPLSIFARYAAALGSLGLWRYPLFHAYFLSLLVLGPRRSDAIIARLKQRIGHTPQLGAARSGK